ncbi:MAG: SDR family oxidoreductase, partial [Actinomycetota bacterium]|nr:SDR family oxidoreductase [Actinomycetota bacterium]
DVSPATWIGSLETMPARLRTGLEDKIAAVTTSTGPIANACAKVLADRGANTTILMQDHPPPPDVDVLVAVFDAAGVPVPDTSGSADAEWEATVGTSARHLYRQMRDAAVAMAARGSGAIVVVAPEAGLAGVRGASVVAAAAGALFSSARALAIEFAPPVRVNMVAYGCIEGDPFSDWLRSADPNGLLALDGELTLLERFGGPEEVATAVAFLASARASFVAAHQLVVDGGYLVH